MESSSQTGQGSSLAEAEKAMSAIEVIVRTLGPLTSVERQRVLQGALIILGESSPRVAKEQNPKSDGAPEGGSVDGEELPQRAQIWMRQNNLTRDQLLNVFDISDGIAVVIASEVSGKGNAEKTIKAYALAGIAALLSTGDASFSDASARELCVSLGCYDAGNHTRHLKDMGNSFTGSKNGGWKLTSPGLRVAASIIAELDH